MQKRIHESSIRLKTKQEKRKISISLPFQQKQTSYWNLDAMIPPLNPAHSQHKHPAKER